jgi:hypothetical protein
MKPRRWTGRPRRDRILSFCNRRHSRREILAQTSLAGVSLVGRILWWGIKIAVAILVGYLAYTLTGELNQRAFSPQRVETWGQNDKVVAPSARPDSFADLGPALPPGYTLDPPQGQPQKWQAVKPSNVFDQFDKK